MLSFHVKCVCETLYSPRKRPGQLVFDLDLGKGPEPWYQEKCIDEPYY